MPFVDPEAVLLSHNGDDDPIPPPTRQPASSALADEAACSSAQQAAAAAAAHSGGAVRQPWFAQNAASCPGAVTPLPIGIANSVRAGAGARWLRARSAAAIRTQTRANGRAAAMSGA